MKKLILIFALITAHCFAQAATTNANVGQTITMTASVASGTGPFKYTWFHNNVPVAGQNANSLIIANAQLADAGAYTVAVENGAGRADSPPVQIAVTQVIIAGGVTISVSVK